MPLRPPGKPRFKAADETSISVEWDAGEPEIRYRVQYKEYPQRWEEALSVEVPKGESQVTASLPNLNPCSTYVIRVVALSASGEESTPGEEVVIDTQGPMEEEEVRGSPPLEAYPSSQRRVEEMEHMLQGYPTPFGLISIETFDPHKTEPPYLTSPRSLEACRMNGVEENELLILPLEYFLKTSGDNMEVVQLRYHRFEQIRRRYVAKVRESRQNLIQAEEKAKTDGAAHRSVEQIRKEFEEAIKAQEKAYLEKLRKRQQKELQQVMLYEIRVSALQERKRREQLEAEEKDREEKRRRAAEKRRQDELKMKADANEREKQHVAELQERREAAKRFEEYKAQAIAKDKEKTAAKKKNEAREAAHLKAHEDHVKATEEIFEWQRQQLEEKERKIKEADIARKKKLEERRWMQAMRAAKHKEQYKKKVARVAEIKKEIVELKKAETLKWLTDKDAIVQRYQERMLRERTLEKMERASHRHDVTKRFNNQQGDGLDESRKKMARKEELFQQQREKLEAMLEMKRARNRLKEDEIRDFMEKKDKADDYRKTKIYAQLAFQDERFKMREDVRIMLASQRLAANRTSFKKKEEILHKFDRLMANSKMSEEELVKAVEHFLGTPMAEGKEGEQGTSADEDGAGEEQEDEDGAEVEEESTSSKAQAAGELIKHLHAPLVNNSNVSIGSAGSLSVDTGNNESNIIALSPKAAGKQEVKRSSNHRATPALVSDKKHGAAAGAAKKHKFQPKIPPQLAYEILETLRKEQNEELKQMLIQEQQRENEREAQLMQTTDVAEQLRLETVVFAHERAEASDRIIRMTEAHEKALEKRKAELEAMTLPPVGGMR